MADAIKRNANLIPSDSVAQALAAFHGYPHVAYNQKSDMWNKDDLYSLVYNEKTTASHILFAFSLFSALKDLKLGLFKKSRDGGSLLPYEKKQLDFLRLRGSNYIFMAALAGCLEAILESKLTNRFRICFRERKSTKDFLGIWNRILNSTLPFSDCLVAPTQKSLGVIQDNEQAIGVFRSFIEATLESNRILYEDFRKLVEVK